MQNVNQSSYLGKEKLTKLLAKFAIPCILSLITSCLYNIVDQIFVGNIVGTAGNAATPLRRRKSIVLQKHLGSSLGRQTELRPADRQLCGA